ncbi:uncharacterized protein UTRI_02168_B [Ustilago trichophora]|uniref:PXA domain-containing protein n=1 Tax=Ustilago trichophora TaxID=86804 RepID=A0A5C3DY41_9BASI|nr:uncharacterized protein UTRI_02168_B [Ustilago trichophora]
MAPEAIRRGAASPSPLSSPTPSAVAAFAVRKDTSSPFSPSAAFRDVASPMSASHASLTTDPVHATLSPRPMSPVAYRIDHTAPTASTSSYNAVNPHTAAASKPIINQNGGRQMNRNGATLQAQPSKGPGAASSSTPSNPDKSTERAFYRRILFQNLSASTEAPSITHDADLDHEIYLLLAYLLRETVLPWYSKLTPDREFLTQITSIIASIIHTVVQRQSSAADSTSVPATSFESDIHAPRSTPNAELPRIHDLLSRDIPLILRQHCFDFRQAQSKVDSVCAPLGTQQSSSTAAVVLSQAEQDEHRRQQIRERLPSHFRESFDPASRSNASYASPLQLAQLFHAASPHPGLDPTSGSLDGKFDMAYLRIAVLNLLSSLLPADEYAPDTEKFIVRDVLVTVLRGALARSFRPWFFVQSIHKTLDALGWPSNPPLPTAQTNGVHGVEQKRPSESPTSSGGAVPALAGLLSRLPTLLLQAWTFIVFTALPFLVRAYLDLFNVQRAANRKKRKQQQQQQHALQGDSANHHRSSAQKGTLPSSISAGSLYERKMHGRFPSRKFQLSLDDTITAQGRSSAIDGNLTPTQADLAATRDLAGVDEAKESSKEAYDATDLPPNYMGNWLDVVEDVLQVHSHVVLRALFGIARTTLGTTGLDESVNRMVMRRINTELRDTQKLTKMVRELRKILLPNGHLPPSVPDPDVETQEAEWIRLRTRLICANDQSGKGLVPWLVKKVLLGSADGGLHRGDRVTRIQDTQIQVQRLTSWLEPFCSAQAAGPNTLLAILLFERVIVVLCPDLALT